MSVPELRVDPPHQGGGPIAEQPELKWEQADVPFAAIRGTDPTQIVEQLQRQAGELADHLRAQQSLLDQREHALQQQIEALEQEVEATRAQWHEREGDEVRRRRAPTVGPPPEVRSRWRDWLSQAYRDRHVTGRTASGVDDERPHLPQPDGNAPLRTVVTRPGASESRTMPNELPPTLDDSGPGNRPPALAGIDARLREIGELYQETEALYRESLEMRLVSEEVWTEINRRCDSSDSLRLIRQLRGRLEGQLRSSKDRLAHRQRQLAEAEDGIARQREELARYRHEVEQWVARRYSELQRDVALAVVSFDADEPLADDSPTSMSGETPVD